MQHLDILIYAGWIIPVEPENTVYEQHALAIQDGKIVAILPNSEAVKRFSARITYRMTTHLLIPGLINAHTHAAMSLLRGIADDMPLDKWLNDHIWPAERAHVNQEFVADGSQLAIAEMLRGGVTCFNDMYFFPDVVGKVAAEIGIRATLGLILIDFPTAWGQNAEEYLNKGRKVYETFQDHPLIKTALAPHAPYSVSDEPLKSAQAMAEEFDIPIHIHLHETAGEIEKSLEQFGERPLIRLKNLGLLSSRLMGVHLTQLKPGDFKLLANHGVHVIHCPESNLKLASGVCPVPKLLNAGVNVALGTDGPASNDDLDMLGEMRTAALLAKGLNGGDASAVPAAQALRMATLNGAKALGIDHITGSFVPGKSADIVAIDMLDIETQPIYNPLSQLVYAIGRDKVTDVWVAGKHLLKSRTLTTIDIHELKAKTYLWRDKIIKFL
ncbi:N-ethylammeline chlorohydrolase [Candidatus Thiomargarita nelsonii]|uniref:5-methylthioadenosine/S-adenosylhomocysteine deaminase n=1 Tax=Candidatus Thiomargarita nelsonii TaxID=1003181 RepID=A0A0A6P3I6_9GAMM|nr:N-ethylammeline chlorohydrolase [Candidatus Thiomargarita nelsonii]